MTNNRHYFERGFTIVELIIVISIIGILATITVVAYNGIQDNARKATVMSDLDSATSILELSLKQNGSYPATKDVADNGNPLPASKGTTYQYTVNTSTTSPSYCITATNGTSSYMVSSSQTSPVSGGCPGHGTGGIAAIINLLTNPDLENGSVSPNWSYFGSPLSVDNTKAYSGNSSLKTITNSTVNAQGLVFAGPVGVPAGTYTCSVWLASSPNASVYVSGRTESPYAESLGTSVIALTSVFQRKSITFTLAAPVGTIEIQTPLTAKTSGVTIWGDAAICTSGSTAYNYSSGNSPNWIWNGTPNNSTSTGPAS